jgi:glucoamylase
MEFIVTDGISFFSEEKRHTTHRYRTVEDGIPLFHVTNNCIDGRYRIDKTILTDPRRNVLLQKVTFTPLQGNLEDYHLYLLLAPHIMNGGSHNTGWWGSYKGISMLFAQKEWITFACASPIPFIQMTAGYVGVSDAWQDLNANKVLTRTFERATDGNIALAAEINLTESKGSFILALSFANGQDEAALQARASLAHDFEWTYRSYKDLWRKAQSQFTDLSQVDAEGGACYRTSTAVLKTHEGKHFSGSVIASLSIPWGFSRPDAEMGGYHLIWPRDQVQTALAFLAAGDRESALETLIFLMCTQEKDGHWHQCMWEDGSPFWDGLQMDETALPILLAEHLRRADYLIGINPWKMIASAVSFIIQNGPVTGQDRWEENDGYTPFTIAVQIVALLAAADMLDLNGKTKEAQYLLETADWWNDNIERWLYVQNTPLSKKMNVSGYYVRIRPPASLASHNPQDQLIVIKNRPQGKNIYHFSEIVSVDALALVRYGLRAPSDPRILNTIAVTDLLLKVETGRGTVWHRYNEDGYGEHADGAPFDGTGVGRGWPLLTGERAHYEIAKKNKEGALKLLRDLVNFAGVGGLIPEQVWDGADIPSQRLYNGRATGSAKPLIWAHAEYITLLRSLQEEKVWDKLPQAEQRYLIGKKKSEFAIWRFNDKCQTIPLGKKLRIQTKEAAIVYWTINHWSSSVETETIGNDLGVYYVDLPVAKKPVGTEIIFTFYWPFYQKWEGVNYSTRIEAH